MDQMGLFDGIKTKTKVEWFAIPADRFSSKHYGFPSRYFWTRRERWGTRFNDEVTINCYSPWHWMHYDFRHEEVWSMFNTQTIGIPEQHFDKFLSHCDALGEDVPQCLIDEIEGYKERGWEDKDMFKDWGKYASN